MSPKILDLSIGSPLNTKDCKVLDGHSKAVRKEYDNFVSELISSNKLIKNGLFLKVSSRNTLVSEVLKDFCHLALIEEKIKKKEIPETLIVETEEMQQVVTELFKKNDLSHIKVRFKKRIQNKGLILILNFLKIIYVIFNSWLFSRLSPRELPQGEIILVDTFMFKESIDRSGNFEDRYYTGHQKYLSSKEKENIWYVPTLFGLKKPQDYLKVFMRSHKCLDNLLIKESWLSFYDYLTAMLYSFRASSEVTIIPKFRGIDVTPIIHKELREDRGSLSVFRALCNYAFYKRISLEGIKISFVINWFENHVNDRALNLSIRKYFKNVYIKGYQGFFLIDYYATYEPTELEYDLGTVPDEINVINEYCHGKIKKQCPKVKINLSPAFRFDHLGEVRDRRSKDTKNIFIPFPGEGMTARGVNLVKNCLSVVTGLNDSVKLYVKPHPSFPEELLKKYDKVMLNEDITFTTNNTASMYEISDVVVATGSVVCVESVSLGIPTAISGNSPEVTMNPIPIDFRPDIWKLFYTGNELKEFIKFAFNLPSRSPSINSLFNSHTREGAKQLFSHVKNVS